MTKKISIWDTHHFFEIVLRSRKDTFLRTLEKIEENRNETLSALDGNIEVDSEYGKETQFIINLPG